MSSLSASSTSMFVSHLNSSITSMVPVRGTLPSASATESQGHPLDGTNGMDRSHLKLQAFKAGTSWIGCREGFLHGSLRPSKSRDLLACFVSAGHIRGIRVLQQHKFSGHSKYDFLSPSYAAVHDFSKLSVYMSERPCTATAIAIAIAFYLFV